MSNQRKDTWSVLIDRAARTCVNVDGLPGHTLAVRAGDACRIDAEDRRLTLEKRCWSKSLLREVLLASVS